MRGRGIAVGAAALFVLVLVALAAGLTMGDDLRTIDGTVYAARPGEDGGAILTSRDTVGRSVGGASIGGRDVLTLGPDCSATADGEVGAWRQTFLGLRVVFPSRTVTFPFRRLPMGDAACRE